MIKSTGIVFSKLAAREDQLAGLITNLNRFSGALAAESSSLSRTVELLAPTLEESEVSLADLNEALPFVRALAIEARPGIQELPATISAANPWLDQTRALVRPSELGGLAKLLRGAAPGLARSTVSARSLFGEQTLLARCTSKVLVPTGEIVVDDQFSSGQPNFNELLFSAVELAGATQGFDGNGPYARLQAGGGPLLLQGTNPGGGVSNTLNFANSVVAPQGLRPGVSARTPPFRMDFPCFKNALPDVNGPAAATRAPDLVPVSP